MRFKSSRGVVVAALGVAVLTGPGLPGAVAADPPTCFGLAATIAPPAGTDHVEGTEGDDVIVATDADTVWSRGGDDTVCVAGTGTIETGDGDDRVRRADTTGATTTMLGAGSDVFEGTDQPDDVYAEYGDELQFDPRPGPTNVDVVRTYGGDDRVEVGDLESSTDQVDLGEGDDRVDVFSPAAGDARVAGGPGRDVYVGRMGGPAGTELAFDLEAGTAASDGVRFSTLTDFEKLGVNAREAAEVRVRGTDRPDRLDVAGPASVDAGAGDDRIELGGDPLKVVGGPGRDKVVMQVYSDFGNVPVVYDLGRRLFTRRDIRAPFAVEDLDLRAGGFHHERVRIVGSKGPNDITARACGAVVLGAGGKDVLRSDRFDCNDRFPTKLYGGGGNDLLRGSDGREVLVGGAGSDRAFGAGGVDRCVAEVERGCERN